MRFSWRHARLGSIGLAAVVGVSFYLVPNARASSDLSPAERPLRGPLAATVDALPDAALLTTPKLASGRLVSSSGQTVAGAVVVLAVEPSNEALAGMKLGQTLPERFIARTTTSTTGAWTLRAPANADLTGSVAKAGDVNFMVLALGSDWSGTTLFSAHATKGRTAPSRSGLMAPARAVGAPITLTPNASTSLVVSATDNATPARDAKGLTPELTSLNPGCGLGFDRDYGPTSVVVGQSFSQAKDVTAHFRYGEGQSSTLGAGVSITGKKGSFKASGTISQSTDDKQGFGRVKGAHNVSYVTKFDWRRYAVSCAGVGVMKYVARAGDWLGGGVIRRAGTIRAGFCVPEGPYAPAVIHSTKARTLGAAANTSGAIGIDLSGQTGYSTHATLSFKMHAKGHPLCGESDYPMRKGHRAGRIQVHSSIVK